MQLDGDACMDDLGGGVVAHERVHLVPQPLQVDVGIREGGYLEDGERRRGPRRRARVVQQLFHGRQHHVHQRRNAQAGELLQGRPADGLVRVCGPGCEQAGNHGGYLQKHGCANPGAQR